MSKLYQNFYNLSKMKLNKQKSTFYCFITLYTSSDIDDIPDHSLYLESNNKLKKI